MRLAAIRLAAICLAVQSALCASAVAPPPQPAASTATDLAQQIAALLAQPGVARDHWGVLVTTLDGAPIYGLNEGQLFQPASNAKLFTTAAALALLGPQKTFKTVAATTGPIKRGVLHGNLYLVGGGDANFGAQDIPYASPGSHAKAPPTPEATIPDIDDLSSQIVAKGIRRIEGNIVGDDSLYEWHPYPPDWAWDDLVWGYGAPVSALTIHDNEIQIHVGPEMKDGASTIPDLPYYTFIDEIMIGSELTHTCESIDLLRTPGTKELRVQGVLHDKSAPCAETIAIDDPAEYAAMALKRSLEAHGVQISGSAQTWHNRTGTERSYVSIDALPAARSSPETKDQHGCLDTVTDAPDVNVIAQHVSPSLAADMTYTNKVSQNLHAELMLRNIAQLDCDHSGKYPDLVRQFLINAGIDPNDFIFYDGSGLSGHDLVTPRATAKLLSYAAHDPKTGAAQPWFADWKASLPIGGEDGTLAGRFPKPPLKDHLFAKTGTLGEARALSGYLECASGRTVIFSIMVGNHLPGTNVDRDAMDRIVAAIAAAE
jgi:D-alanyl-D-alanine carboxypeptidase/D-alanyl-D-alanine-endopeptidase (penicillin-binding protein 4)